MDEQNKDFSVNNDKNRRYYWLKIHEHFFEEDTINWLEDQENGKDYVLFYLKMCVKSLRSDGVLVRTVGDTIIPYDEKALSKLTNTNIDIVRVALELFRRIGLISVMETGEIFLTQLNELVGNETVDAMRKRRAKALKNMPLENVRKISGKLPRDKDKDKEIDKEIDSKSNIGQISSADMVKSFESEIGMLSPAIARDLDDYRKELPEEVVIAAIEQAGLYNKRSWAYVRTILESAVKGNIKTAADLKNKKPGKKKSDNDDFRPGEIIDLPFFRGDEDA